MKASTFCLYKSDNRFPVNEFNLEALNLFITNYYKAFGLAPDNCYVTYDLNKINAQPKKFKFSRINDLELVDSIKTLSTQFYGVNQAQRNEFTDWKIHFSISRRHVSLSHIYKDIYIEFERFIQDVSKFFQPEYGFYDLISCFSPALYAMGYPHAGSSENKTNLFLDTQTWQRSWDYDKPNVFNDGVFRRIFSENLINDSHLALKIDHQLLNDWVKNNDVGHVKAIGNKKYILTVFPDKINIISAKLFDQGKTILGWGKQRGYHWIQGEWLEYQPL